jgi:hypothetical protein
MKGGATIINGKSFSLQPALDENKQLYWICTSTDIKDRYLPMECRHNN